MIDRYQTVVASRSSLKYALSFSQVSNLRSFSLSLYVSDLTYIAAGVFVSNSCCRNGLCLPLYIAHKAMMLSLIPDISLQLYKALHSHIQLVPLLYLLYLSLAQIKEYLKL